MVDQHGLAKALKPVAKLCNVEMFAFAAKTQTLHCDVEGREAIRKSGTDDRSFSSQCQNNSCLKDNKLSPARQAPADK